MDQTLFELDRAPSTTGQTRNLQNRSKVNRGLETNYFSHDQVRHLKKYNNKGVIRLYLINLLRKGLGR